MDTMTIVCIGLGIGLGFMVLVCLILLIGLCYALSQVSRLEKAVAPAAVSPIPAPAQPAPAPLIPVACVSQTLPPAPCAVATPEPVNLAAPPSGHPLHA